MLKAVIPMGSGNLGVGPVPVNVEAKGRDWTVESDTLPTPGGSLAGTRSVYLLANSELLSNTTDKGRMGVGPVPVASDILAQQPTPQRPAQVTLGTRARSPCQSQLVYRRWPNAGFATGAGAYAGAL